MTGLGGQGGVASGGMGGGRRWSSSGVLQRRVLSQAAQDGKESVVQVADYASFGVYLASNSGPQRNDKISARSWPRTPKTQQLFTPRRAIIMCESGETRDIEGRRHEDLCHCWRQAPQTVTSLILWSFTLKAAISAGTREPSRGRAPSSPSNFWIH